MFRQLLRYISETPVKTPFKISCVCNNKGIQARAGLSIVCTASKMYQTTYHSPVVLYKKHYTNQSFFTFCHEPKKHHLKNDNMYSFNVLSINLSFNPLSKNHGKMCPFSHHAPLGTLNDTTENMKWTCKWPYC